MTKEYATPKNYLTVLFWGLILLTLLIISRSNYLLFHGLAEVFSIVVAIAIFIIVWNARETLDDHYILFIGIAFVFVALLDLVHTLAFKGMVVFPAGGSNLPTQLWIAGRYLESVSLLAAPLFIRRKVSLSAVFGVYAGITTLLLAAIFYWQVFPDCYIEGRGLTAFKKVSELIIISILLAAIAFLRQRRRSFEPEVLRFLVLALAAKIVSELFFIFYIDVYGLSNLSGHYLKIISYYFFYKAFIQVALRKPFELLFRNLKQSEGRYRAIIEDQIELICRFTPDGILTFVNRAFCRYFRQEESALLGREFAAFLQEGNRDIFRRHCGSCTLQNPVSTYEVHLTDVQEPRWQQWTCRAIYGPEDALIEFQAVGLDVSARKQAEEALQKAHDELEKRVAERTLELTRSNSLLRESEAELRRLSAKLLKAQESERRLVARELHDAIGQGLSAVKFGVENSLQKIGSGNHQAALESLKPVISIIQQTVEEVRRIARNLWPGILEDLGLLAAISWFCREYENIYAPIRVDRRIELEEADLGSPEIKIIVFRIIQEALNNIAKHSQAQQVFLSLQKEHGEIVLTVRDMGRGFDIKEAAAMAGAAKGLGLSSMKERAELSGGRFLITSRPGEGTVIQATWPAVI